MTSSLVGSEMCIRDRHYAFRRHQQPWKSASPPEMVIVVCAVPLAHKAVSYTHLTLPTICSV
eukprot:2533337-Prorocentrum_lima.AAC.1